MKILALVMVLLLAAGSLCIVAAEGYSDERFRRLTRTGLWLAGAGMACACVYAITSAALMPS